MALGGFDRHGRASRAAPRRLRRDAPAEEEAIIETPDFTVDLTDERVIRDGAEVRLTPTEWQIVEVLVRNPGKLVTRRQLLQDVWGPQYERETNDLRVYLAQIRRKLEPDPTLPRYFVREPRMGYRLVGGDGSCKRTD